MNSLQQLFLFLSITLSLFGCGNSSKILSPKKYTEWYVSDKFIWKSSDTLNNLIYSFRYLPVELELATCALENCKPEKELQKTLKAKNHSYTFVFEVKSQKWNQSISDFIRPELSKTEMMTYLNGPIKNDLRAVSTDKDTIACSGIIYEPISSNKVRLLISFDAEKGLNEILLYDRLFSGYTQNYKIPQLTFKSTPSLKF